jgi:peptidoglycan/xylan/chitin deacetylase (PgdA/CDA1 family)
MAMASQAKNLFKKTLVASGCLRAAAHFSPPGAVALMYHSIVEDPALTENSIGTSKSSAVFESHMRALAEKFNPVSLDEIVDFAKGRKTLPSRSVAITFDDGFLDNYEIALPILKRYNIPSTIYVMVGAVETGSAPWYCRINYALRTTRKPSWTDPETGTAYPLATIAERKAALTVAWESGARKTGATQAEYVQQLETTLDSAPIPDRLMMTWDQVRAVQKAGHIIGGHTLSHPNLAHISDLEAKSEIEGCKQRLEKELSSPVEHFSYPHPALNPQCNDTTVAITRAAGYKSSVLTSRGPIRKGDEPLRLKRIYAANDLDQFIWNLEVTFLGRAV